MADLQTPYRSGRIVVLADLHLDHWDRAGRNPLCDFELEDLVRSDLDALIIAGDLINGPPANLTKVFGFLAAYIDLGCIYVLPGNHDYYRSSLSADPEIAVVVEATGAHFVQQKVLHHGTTRILCVTMWTDYDLLGDRREAMMVAERLMNDHRFISRDAPDPADEFEALLPPSIERRVSAGDLRALHLKHRAWLESELARSHPDGEEGQTVVITHHGLHPLIAGNIDKLTPAFHSDLTDVLQNFEIDAWFFGHSHRHHRATVEGCDIRNISIGYPDERYNQLGYLDSAAIWESRHGSE